MKADLFRRDLDALSAATWQTVFTTEGLTRALMPSSSPRAAARTLRTAVRSGVLVRLCRGAYLYRYAPRRGLPVREETVLRLRPGEFNYISLETALSMWGLIDQEALGALTVMSTGRSQRLRTPRGFIDITHTAKRPAELATQIVPCDPRRNWLPYAKPRRAVADLLRVGRNTDLLDISELDAVEQEMAA